MIAPKQQYRGMGRLAINRHLAVARFTVMKTTASFRKDACFSAVCVVFICHLCSPWTDLPSTVSFVNAAAQDSEVTAFGTPTSTLSVIKDRNSEPHRQSSDHVTAEPNGNRVFHPISFAGCRVPLAVGGEIVRCERGTEASEPTSYVSGNSRDPLGPLLNQSVAVEIDDFSDRSTTWQQRTHQTVESSSALDIAEESAGSEKERNSPPWNARNPRDNAPSENPVFIRIFGRWTPFVGDLHLWLDEGASHDPLRRLAGEAASHSQPNRSPGTSFHPWSGLTAPDRDVASDKPEGQHPFLYWRESSFSLSVQNSCIALIKLPAKEGSTSVPTNPTTASIPESCGEAQRLLSSQELSSEPFWLSCGPQLELSKLTHFVTFSVSQEKVNQVLAALNYSVEVWREPHDLPAPANNAPRPSPHELNRFASGSSQEQAESEVPQKQGATGSFAAQPEVSPARDVEARRLAADQGEALPEPPKWRVGICFLKGPHGGKKDRITEELHTRTELQVEVEKSTQPAIFTQKEPKSGERGRDEQITGSLKVDKTSKKGMKPKDIQKFVEDTDAQLVGEIKFHVRPEITTHADDDEHEDPEAIQIRHFIDAGWMYTREVRGVNLTRFNRLALKESREGASRPCIGFWEEHSLLSVAPESYAWDQMTNEETLRFVFSSSLKGPVESREALYNSVPGRHAAPRMHICFYSNDEQPFGLFLGEVQFVIDSADATLLVFFILFVFLAIPVMCAVAISFHVYKHRHLRERLQRLVLVQQRDAVEQLLMRELGLTREDPDDANDDDEEEPQAEGAQNSLE